VEKELSAYYVADEVSMTYRGMMIAIPEEEWTIFARLSVVEWRPCCGNWRGRCGGRNSGSRRAAPRSLRSEAET